MASMNTFIGPDLPSHDACALYFYFIFAATSFYLQQLIFICSNILFLQQLLFEQQPLFLQRL